MHLCLRVLAGISPPSHCGLIKLAWRVMVATDTVWCYQLRVERKQKCVKI